MSLRRVLIANRGEIAVRVIRACNALDIESVIAVSEADTDSLGARLADRAVCIGPANARASYLNQDALLAAALGTGSDAIHPGYGFLAENASFARACHENDVVFVGPRSDTVRVMGNKLEARTIAEAHGVPLVPGSLGVKSYRQALQTVETIGLPVLLKAAAGGGGRGIRVVHDVGELQETFQSASAEADSAFGDGTLYIERFVANGRHIEVQVFGDGQGDVIHLGERDCSLQRRYQKVVEEAPASTVPDELGASIRKSAVLLAQAIGYENAGTVEFIYDVDRNEYYFLEMNTRIQVEHPVTEEITGLDLVQMQLRIAGGESLPLDQRSVRFDGHSIECRITAESPADGFRPSPGQITSWRPPEGPGVRLDTHCYPGYQVPPFYDSLLGKLIVHGPDRVSAVERMRSALQHFEVQGIDTTIAFLASVMEHPEYQTGRINTRWLEKRIDDLRPA